LGDAARQLLEYFAGARTTFDLLLAPSGTPFQQSVWAALRTIPYGTTASYAEVAELVGRPRAFRAVGQANGANPIPIIVPCHRVIAAGGGLGGYSGGLGVKMQLLAVEGRSA
jgi:methylated-DNA-[protein]-cysteine S-methyltransferase